MQMKFVITNQYNAQKHVAGNLPFFEQIQKFAGRIFAVLPQEIMYLLSARHLSSGPRQIAHNTNLANISTFCGPQVVDVIGIRRYNILCVNA